MGTPNQMSKKERRVTLALKWAHLEQMEASEIQERFEELGYGSYTIRTITGYLNSKPGEEVREQIRQEHKETRLQIADRQERLYQRAREAEMDATEEEPVMGLVPEEEQVDGRLSSAKQIPYSWSVVQPGDEIPDSAPEGADPEIDTIIEIDPDGMEMMEPGSQYPKRDWKGEPVYTKEAVGIKRDTPATTQRSFLRQEQQGHLRAKGEAMGIYEDTINLQGDLGVEAEVEVPDELVQAVITASQDRLSSGSGDDADE